MFAPYSRDAIQLRNDRIAPRDAARQEGAAVEILRRLEMRPGVVLADEVGMGKTFVALAVATSVALARPVGDPVVIMVPPTLKDKWPKDWTVFRERCLRPDTARMLRAARATSGLEFLKLLDDPPDRRAHLIFLTHGALHRALNDGFAQLAVIKRALKGRSSLTAQRRAFGRFADRLLWLGWAEKRAPGILARLLELPYDRWQAALHRADSLFVERVADDPVPDGLQKALDEMDSESFVPLVEALRALPLRHSANIDARLKAARTAISDALGAAWKTALQGVRFRSPLLVLDEAHHVKNPATRLASLFVDEEAAKDSDVLAGPLGGKFERMLFLTATPFQLGHDELVRVLERFDGVAWSGSHAPEIDRREFREELRSLRESLDEAQSAGLRLDRAWGKLTHAGGLTEDRDLDEWWRGLQVGSPDPVLQSVLEQVDVTRRAMRSAEARLRPWVLRHLKPANLPAAPEVLRRLVLPGAAILGGAADGLGLEIEGEVLLPFLLAGRAQGLLAASRRGRALFAEGLASSFEAYVETRSEGGIPDEDADLAASADTPELNWYLDHLDRVLPRTNRRCWTAHPKVRATAERAVALWRAGEKVLVFCHYRATGRALRAHISALLQEEIVRLGQQTLPGTAAADVPAELDVIGDRFFDVDGPLRVEVTEALRDIVASYAQLNPLERERVVEVVRRFLRTPSFLVRHFDLGAQDRAAAFRQAIERHDVGGLSLRRRIEGFCDFLARCVGAEPASDGMQSERGEILEALESIQTGTQFGREIAASFDPAETGRDGHGTVLLPNVRLANGGVKAETRRKLLLTFNTPLFPEILIASSVLAEGVDLHRHCRYVIHHDLCWNPSTLEQRTGRIDRIGSKAEQVGKSIHVYLPYVAATQDEKMYRVVRERERWFQIVMGERYQVDEASTDQRAERLPLPPKLAAELAMKLDLGGRDEPAGS
jgi:hypothetical protein